jgi:hypothetical protein
MTTAKLQLSKESLAQLTQFEASISHWSSEHVVLTLKARKMLEAIDSMYLSRQKIIDDLLSDNNIKPADVKDVNVGPNGEVVVQFKEVSAAQ